MVFSIFSGYKNSIRLMYLGLFYHSFTIEYSDGLLSIDNVINIYKSLISYLIFFSGLVPVSETTVSKIWTFLTPER